ncbi:MAG: NAD(FAD)-utilizing dehydrogenase [Rhizobiales bacterium 65-9]|nr:MAG: NAD(FAD)-utilizing dehydrogenase [Rhizobiales bacterium 65-9]
MPSSIAIIGAGPAGLIAAETLATAGVRVTVHERMPSPARKLLMAGRGGLNLTHSEPLARFLDRYDDAPAIREAVERFPPSALRQWAEGLGQTLFVGSSGRVFPQTMKASPLLRAWLRRLESLGVEIRLRSEWRGFDSEGRLSIAGANGETVAISCDATILACGGANWPRLGADGGWVAPLKRAGVATQPLRASNMGARIAWTPAFAERFAGAPLKRIALTLNGETRRGELVITRDGLEGGALYALSRALRESVGSGREATLVIDLRPDLAQHTLSARLAAGRSKDSLSTKLKRSAGLSPPAIGLLREASKGAPPADPAALAALIKAAPIRVAGLAGLDRAISTAGGVARDAIDDRFMLKALPGVFVAGEMLDWDAPTGGYLLQACFATGVAAAKGALAWLATGRSPPA